MVVTRRAGIVGNRRMFQLNKITPEFFLDCHKNCIVNLEKSVMERIIYVKGPDGSGISPPEPKKGVFSRRLRGFLEEISKFASVVTPMQYEEFIQILPGTKRRAYEEAFMSLQESPLVPSDAHVKVFIKYEKEIFQDKSPVPRSISPRSYRFLLSDAVYYHPLEKTLMGDIDKVFREPTVMKGLTVEGVAQCIVEKWESIPNCVAIGVDASRFDQHVSFDALVWQHRVQSNYFKGVDKALYKRLLRMKLYNQGTGKTPDGKLTFKVKGKRMSGDMDTGGGNCLLMCAMMHSFFRSLNIPSGRIKLVNNGDDCVIFVERRYEHLVRESIGPWFLGMGFNMVSEDTSRCIEEVEFCQMRPVCVDGKWRMVRNPFRAIPKDCTSVRRIDIPKVFRKWTTAVSDCGLSLCNGVPVQQSFYQSIGRSVCPAVRKSKSRRVQQRMARLVLQDESGLYKWKSESEKKVISVTDSTRLSYFAAFGITPEQQLYLETFYNENQPAWAVASVDHLHNPSPLLALLTGRAWGCTR